MRIFNKKITLSFYAYSSVVILLIFTITSICEHFLPTNLFVKSLIVFSLLCFFVTAIIYIANEVKRKPVLFFLILGLFMGLFLILFFNESQDKKYNLTGHYTQNVLRYKGSTYKQGFALSEKIDDRGIVSSPLWQTLLKASIKQKDSYLFRNFLKYWWHNFTIKDLHNEKMFICIDKQKVLYYRQGDLIYKDGYFSVFIKYKSLKQPKEEIWVTSTPTSGCFSYERKNSSGKYDVYRWKIFEPYLNR